MDKVIFAALALVGIFVIVHFQAFDRRLSTLEKLAALRDRRDGE
ncbi:hypothetical protein [Rhizorhabdus histidinilytica]|nr:hypothetical protein [Rhizorhabdus histidinilytica]